MRSPENMEDKKDSLERKEGNFCPIAFVRKRKVVTLTIPQVFSSWYFGLPYEKTLRSWKIWCFFERWWKNIFPVTSIHYQERANINGKAPYLTDKVEHSGKVWGIFRELKKNDKGIDSIKTGSWYSENKRTK